MMAKRKEWTGFAREPMSQPLDRFPVARLKLIKAAIDAARAAHARRSASHLSAHLGFHISDAEVEAAKKYRKIIHTTPSRNPRSRGLSTSSRKGDNVGDDY
jgi:hypothetical protein